MQRAATRNLATRATFDQAIREGHTKTKYTELLWALREQVLTASQWATAWLKGHATEAEAKAGGAAVGYPADAMELLYLNQGRPATVRQIHLGYARGADLPGVPNEIEAIRTAVRQSNIRTEYADLLIAQRYTYPSAFVLRALAADGTFSQDEARTILVESGWRPEWAEAAAAKWSGAAGATAGGKWADRARGRLFTSTHDEPRVRLPRRRRAEPVTHRRDRAGSRHRDHDVEPRARDRSPPLHGNPGQGRLQEGQHDRGRGALLPGRARLLPRGCARLPRILTGNRVRFPTKGA
jgi:hypothetical protein